MNSETIVMCVVALLLGMLLANMLKSVCGCKTVEGQTYSNLRCGAKPGVPQTSGHDYCRDQWDGHPYAGSQSEYSLAQQACEHSPLCKLYSTNLAAYNSG
jgi:hypothetical protein